jgi:DNA-binding LacI/PurR family transcriptional regulator
MLLNLIHKPEEKQSSVVVPIELIIRESTAAPAALQEAV